MEDLPLGSIAALLLEFAVKDLPLGRTLIWDHVTNDVDIITNCLSRNLEVLYLPFMSRLSCNISFSVQHHNPSP